VQPGAVILIFQCYTVDPLYGGSGVATATTTPIKTRQRGHALSTLDFPPKSILSYRYLVSSPSSPPSQRPPHFSFLSDLYVSLSTGTYLSRGTHDSLLRMIVTGSGYRIYRKRKIGGVNRLGFAHSPFRDPVRGSPLLSLRPDLIIIFW